MKTIKELMGLGAVPDKNKLGIEVEISSESPLPKYPVEVQNGVVWRSELDHSLKKNYSREYVLVNPIPLASVKKALQGLSDRFEEYGSKPIYNYQAGVHVHLNVQKYSAEQVVRIALVYYSLETFLLKFCGDSREGNHFCLRIRDAEGPLTVIESMKKSNDIARLCKDNYRYASLNMSSLSKYGSIEFRAMETMPDLSKIYDWCNILTRVEKWAIKMDSRQDIANNISGLGPEGFAREILGERLLEKLWYDGAEQDIYEDMQLCQLAIYKGDLSE